MRSRRLDDDDLARLWMDTHENPMVVTAVVRLDALLELDALVALVDERILVHERMRARILRPGLVHRKPRWREVEPQARRHVTRLELAAGATETDLANLVSDLTSWPLDPRMPPWRIWLVDGAGDGSALVFRIHHAVADGVALLALLFSFSDEGVGAALPDAHAAPPDAESSVVRRATALARLFFRHAHTPPSLAGALAGRKRIAWTAPIDVASLRRAAHVVDAHINDVLLGIVAGAVRELLMQDGKAPATALHALVPVALRHEGNALGNRYVSLFVPLPVELASPLDRVIAARDAIREVRARDGVPLGRGLVAAASLAGRHAEQAAVRMLSRKASLVVTDLAGPPSPLHLAGRRITEVVFAAPAPGEVALSASAFSYAGELRVTIATDAAVIPDPSRVLRLVEEQARATIDDLLEYGSRRA